MEIGLLLLLAFIGSAFSLLGGILLLSNQHLATTIARFSAPFAAGALLSAVFFDLLPESIEKTDRSVDYVLLWTLLGIGMFFVLERRLRWFHHHGHEDKKNEVLSSMLVIGDTLHNAIDGAVIAFAYLSDPAVGVVTAVAVATHELPQEIGDFGILLKSGWKRRKIVVANVLSALATVVVAVAVYYFGRNRQWLISPALSLSAGVLLYIALSGVLPSVHDSLTKHKWFNTTNILFFVGMAIVYSTVYLSHIIER